LELALRLVASSFGICLLLGIYPMHNASQFSSLLCGTTSKTALC
jgi:hypothetical protein